MWTYDPNRTHAATQAGGSSYTYSYDANGNAITRNGYTVDWTSYNHPRLINSGGESVGFAYDHNHTRYSAVYSGANGVETTYFVGGLLEKVATAGAAEGVWRRFSQATEPVSSRRVSPRLETDAVLAHGLGLQRTEI
jgi:YD repeat-containing protein